jgi:hypothetical protein
MDVDTKRAKHQAAAPADRGNNAGLARARTFEPAAPDRSGYAEQNEEQRIHPAHAGDAPVASGRDQFLQQRHVRAGLGLRHAERARQRQPEHAETVCHADAQMNAKRGRRHQPAVEAGFGDDAFLVENSGGGPDKAACLFDRRH